MDDTLKSLMKNDVAKTRKTSPCAAKNDTPALAPVDEGGSGSLVLARTTTKNAQGPRTLAIAADEDDQMLHLVDVDSQTPIGTTKLAGKPSRIVVTADGRIVVSLRDKGALEVFEAESSAGFPLARRCLVETPEEPVGLAITPDQKTLLVVSRWGQMLSSFKLAEMTPRLNVELPRDPTSVLASSDGKRVFVTHAAGGLISVVELDASTKTRSVPLLATRHQEVSNMEMMMMPSQRVPQQAQIPGVVKKKVSAGEENHQTRTDRFTSFCFGA